MTQNSDFLPENYQAPQGGGNYLKLQTGENRFRILSRPIIGWLDWKDNKPLRFRMENKPALPNDPKKPIKHFWAMVVYNCVENKLQILEITQSSIQTAIQNLSKDKDWGAPMGYDIKVTKSGAGMDTEYTVNPVPHKPITPEMTEALKNKPVNLEALYEGADPFAATPVVNTGDLPY